MWHWRWTTSSPSIGPSAGRSKRTTRLTCSGSANAAVSYPSGPVWTGTRSSQFARFAARRSSIAAMMAAVTVGESISFDKVAAIYDATRGGLERGIRFAAAIQPFCGPGPVLEIGVGTGAIAQPLRDRLGRTVCGIDLSGEMLGHARARLGPAVVRSDVGRLPVRDGAVDTVLACWVLHLVGDPEATLRDTRRVL